MARRLVPALVAAVALAIGVLVAPAAFAVAPTVSSFTPTSGPAGTQVTITGTNFGGFTTVKFHGVASQKVTVVSSTTIKATVPGTASTGTISVTTLGGTATSTGTFTVTSGLTRTLSVGPPGTALSVSASGFGAGEAVDLYFDTTDLYLGVTDANGTLTTPVKVPTTATPGTHWFTAIGRRTGSAAQASFTVRTDWAQPAFGAAHTGANPYENVLTPATVDHAAARWATNIGAAGLATTPAVVAGTVYVAGSDGNLTAVNAATGAVRWRYRYDTTPAGLRQLSSPVVAGGLVYVGRLSGGLVAVNAATGALKWQVADQAVVSPPVVSGAAVYYGTKPLTSADSGALVARNAATGALLWSDPYAAGAEVHAPSVSRGLVYATHNDGSVDDLAAVRADSGTAVWDTGVQRSGSFPVVTGTRVCVLSLVPPNGEVVCLKPSSGAFAWFNGWGNPGTFRALATAGGRLFAGNRNGTFDALDASVGGALWTQTRNPPIDSYVTVAGGVVYGSTAQDENDHTDAFDERTGEFLRSFDVGGAGGVAVADGALYGMSDFELVRYDLGTAAPRPRPTPSQLRPDRTLTAHPAA